jgi:site-specific DNA-methyltransferase (adenine-specific)
VHEFAVQFYRGPWDWLYRSPVYTADATDGGPRLMRSVLRVRSEHGRAEHPTQKPLGIVRPLIEYSCPPDGIVLDPFMGSGTTLRAAKDLGRKAIGIEIEERYCEIAAKRMAQAVLL